MVRLVSDVPPAARDDLVLEVDRVEDARTVRQLFRVPAEHWQAFLAARPSGMAPADAEQAYRALKDFWDWLAEAHADTPPGEFAAPGVEWLERRHADWEHGS